MEQKQILVARITNEQELVTGVVTPGEFVSNILYGHRGVEIERLQKVLKRLGFFPGRITTQYFGDITKSSLLAFQKSHGLNESGELDETTRNTLNRIVSGA